MTPQQIAGATWLELRWWLALLGRVVRRFPGQTAVVAGLAWIVHPAVPAVGLISVAGVAAVLRLWGILAPLSCQRWPVDPLPRLWRRVWVRRHWAELAFGCGLSGAVERRSATEVSRHVPVPRLRRISTEGPRLTLHLVPLVGQTVETYNQAAEQLRMAVGATRVRTDPEGVNRVALTFTIGDVLAEPFGARRPDATDAVICPDVLMGRREDGSPWHLPVGPHTLVAGTSGSGKGSVFWSFAFGLAPGVRAGTVELHGVDLKGGMEILLGDGLFSSRATDAAEAVALLEGLVVQMQQRTKRYAGQVRSHAPSEAEPLHVVMIDELAALTAYCPERDLQRRAEMAINLLCSQGRAPGFVVFACLQDPRKEVIPSRGLFTQMVGLRLKDTSETAMVLGDNAVTSGAHCHRITRSTPGMGYVVPEDGGFPVRVRAGFVSDDEIRAVATEFAATELHRREVPMLSPGPVPARRSKARGSEVA